MRTGLGAITTFESLSKLFPKNIVYPVEIGRLHFDLENYPESAAAYDRAIEINSEAIPPRAARIRVEETQHGFERAERLAMEMRDEMGQTPLSDIMAGDLYFRANKFAQAEPFYRAAYEAEPVSRILIQLHQTYEKMGQIETGQEYLEAWLTDNPDDDQVRFLLSDALIKRQQFDRAITEGEKVLETNPKNAAVLNNLAWLYGEKGDTQKALEMAEKAYERQPKSPEIADTLGWLLLSTGDDVKRAVDLLKSANDELPDNNEIAYHYAVALNETNFKSDALELLQKALDSGTNFNSLPEAKALYDELSN